MNPLLRALRRGRSSGAAAGSARVEGYTTNLQTGYWYSDTWLFANLVRMGRNWLASEFDITTPPTFQNANKWFTNMPIGAEAVLPIIATELYLLPGDYMVSSTKGVTCGIKRQAALTNVVQGTTGSKDATFTVPEGAGSGVIVWISVKNETGAVIALMNELYCGLVSNKAAYDAGELFEPRVLAQIAGTNCIRFNDLQGLNPGPNYSLDPAVIPTEANCFWAGTEGGYVANSIPPSVCAKLAKKMNAVMWFAVPLGNETSRDVIATASTDRITTLYNSAPSGHGFVDGDDIAFFQYPPTGFSAGVRYYVRDADTTTFKVAATLGGAAIDIPSDTAASFNRYVSRATGREPSLYYDAWIDQAANAWPEMNVVGEVGNESWNPTYQFLYIAFIGPLVAGTTNTAALNENAAKAYAWYQTKLWQAIENRLSRGQNLRLTTTQPTYTGLMQPNLEWVSTVLEPGTLYKNMIDGFCTAHYVVPNQTYDQEVAAGALTWTNAQWLTYYLARVDACALEAATDIANTPLQYRSIPRYMYETGVQVLGSQGSVSNSDFALLQSKRKLFFESAEAYSFGYEYVERVFKANGLKNSLIWQAANWADLGGSAWGMNRRGVGVRNAYNQGVVDAWAAP